MAQKRYKYVAKIILTHRVGHKSSQTIAGEFYTLGRLLRAIGKQLKIQDKSFEVTSWSVTIQKIDRYHEGA